jgi:glucan 1,3-beta-glucosidase
VGFRLSVFGFLLICSFFFSPSVSHSHSISLAHSLATLVPWLASVNIGGWLNLEPFITPALYEPFNLQAVDEWTLSTLLQAANGNLDVIANHYATFITEEDFAQIAAAGLNWVRIPLPFWAIEVYPNEPFLAKTSWTYFLKAIEWARKYGLRINLDLHAVPGSQNGWNHSGKLGDINFLNGVMGVANAQRTLDYIRILAEFISQPEYRNVVPFFGILNEPIGTTIGEDAMKSFYAQAYDIIRTAGGSGQGNGPVISIYEAYFTLAEWVGYLPGADRLALDGHPYLVFQTLTAGNPADFVSTPCNNWSAMYGASSSAFGITTAGEWSFAINDCGLYVNAVGKGTRYEGTIEGNARIGDCAPWNDYSTWDQSIKDGLKSLGMSTMDALGDSFFWTWKIGPSLATGKIQAPFWSYQLGLEQGWAAPDPRTSKGNCARIGGPGNSFYGGGGTYSGAQIGVGVTDAIANVPTLHTYPWPPAAIGSIANAATLPTYTATGPVPTLPVSVADGVQVTGTASVPQPTATVSLGNGWANPADTGLMHVPIPGCAYPNQWDANNAAAVTC